MNLLAIETSCDETAAAVIAETGDPSRPWQLRSSIVASQTAVHREWGGVVPELASRQHVRDICGVYEEALARSGTAIADISAIVRSAVVDRPATANVPTLEGISAMTPLIGATTKVLSR